MMKIRRVVVSGVLMGALGWSCFGQDSFLIRRHGTHYDATMIKAGQTVELSEFATSQVAEDYAKTQGIKPVYYCGAPTKKGTACRRRVKVAGTRCYQHKKAK